MSRVYVDCLSQYFYLCYSLVLELTYFVNYEEFYFNVTSWAVSNTTGIHLIYCVNLCLRSKEQGDFV